MSVFLGIYRRLGALQVAIAQLPAADPEATREAVALELHAERQARELIAQLQQCARITDIPEIALAAMATLRDAALVAELERNSRDASGD